MPSDYKEILVGLDIGTSKVIAVVGEIDASGHIDVLGYGVEQTSGLKKGMVVNIDATVKSVKAALHDAEKDANCEIKSVFTGIAGSHIQGKDNSGSARIGHKEVTQDDVDRVLETARAFRISADDRLLHVLAQDFSVDGQSGIKDPIGMTGVRLDANVHLVTGSASAAENITKCIERSEYKVDGLILQPLASAESVLLHDEKEIGVALIDIGAGTTDISVFTDGFIRHTEVIPIAGDQITNDIAVFTRSSNSVAESLKTDYASCHTNLVNATQTIPVPTVGNRGTKELKMYTLAQVTEARVRELLALVADKLKQSGYDNLGAGVVITGGTSKLKGMELLAQEELRMPVRIGIPLDIDGPDELINDPAYATVTGLIRYGFQEGGDNMTPKPKKARFLRAKDWLKQLF